MVPAADRVNSVPAEDSTSVRDATTTFAPCAANPRHMARPMPRLPPVTSATLSRNVIAIFALPGAGVGHAAPGLGRRQRAAGLQQLDGDAVRRADEGHAA